MKSSALPPKEDTPKVVTALPPVTTPTIPPTVTTPTIPTTPTTGGDMKETSQPVPQKKTKKGFKKCTSLALPKGMDKLMENIKVPMQDIQAMMKDDEEALHEDRKAQQAFHSFEL